MTGKNSKPDTQELANDIKSRSVYNISVVSSDGENPGESVRLGEHTTLVIDIPEQESQANNLPVRVRVENESGEEIHRDLTFDDESYAIKHQRIADRIESDTADLSFIIEVPEKAEKECPDCGVRGQALSIDYRDRETQKTKHRSAGYCRNRSCGRAIYPKSARLGDDPQRCPYCDYDCIRSWGRVGGWTMNKCEDCGRQWQTDGGILSKAVNGLLNPIRARSFAKMILSDYG